MQIDLKNEHNACFPRSLYFPSAKLDQFRSQLEMYDIWHEINAIIKKFFEINDSAKDYFLQIINQEIVIELITIIKNITTNGITMSDEIRDRHIERIHGLLFVMTYHKSFLTNEQQKILDQCIANFVNI